MRQRVSVREHFRRGNAATTLIVALHRYTRRRQVSRADPGELHPEGPARRSQGGEEAVRKGSWAPLQKPRAAIVGDPARARRLTRRSPDLDQGPPRWGGPFRVRTPLR